MHRQCSWDNIEKVLAYQGSWETMNQIGGKPIRSARNLEKLIGYFEEVPS